MVCGRPSAVGELSSGDVAGPVRPATEVTTEGATECCSRGGCSVVMSDSREKAFETCKTRPANGP